MDDDLNVIVHCIKIYRLGEKGLVFSVRVPAN